MDEQSQVLAQVSGHLAAQVERAGARVVSVTVNHWYGDFPVPVVAVSLHVATDLDCAAQVLAGLLGLGLAGDETRQDTAWSDGEVPSWRRWLRWSGWYAEESVPCPVLWEVVTSYALDLQAVA